MTCYVSGGTLNCVQVDSVRMVVTNSTQLCEQRRQFERQIGKLITLVNEQTSCHQAIAESLSELKVNTFCIFHVYYCYY